MMFLICAHHEENPAQQGAAKIFQKIHRRDTEDAEFGQGNCSKNKVNPVSAIAVPPRVLFKICEKRQSFHCDLPDKIVLPFIGRPPVALPVFVSFVVNLSSLLVHHSAIAHSLATILFARVPICGDDTSTVSPTLRNRSSGRLPSGPRRDLSAAVPAEVPPAITSPGTKVKSCDRYSSTSPKSQIISFVL